MTEHGERHQIDETQNRRDRECRTVLAARRAPIENGTNTRNAAANPNATTPMRSPSRPRMWLGSSFNV
jgi:hypothetical protein